eukprot:scaffold116219_cov60-Phaeocystis_antarctica.AAC.4
MLEQQQQVQRMQGKYGEQMKRLQRQHTGTVEWLRAQPGFSGGERCDINEDVCVRLGWEAVHAMCNDMLLCGFILLSLSFAVRTVRAPS